MVKIFYLPEMSLIEIVSHKFIFLENQIETANHLSYTDIFVEKKNGK